MTFDTYSYYLNSCKIERYFTTLGYNVRTFRAFSKENLGISGIELKKKYDLKESLLNSKLVYKNEELFELKAMMEDLLDFVGENGKTYRWYRSKYVLFERSVYSIRYSDRSGDSKVIGKFEMKTRFKKIIRNYIESLINDKNDESSEFGYY